MHGCKLFVSILYLNAALEGKVASGGHCLFEDMPRFHFGTSMKMLLKFNALITSSRMRINNSNFCCSLWYSSIHSSSD